MNKTKDDDFSQRFHGFEPTSQIIQSLKEDNSLKTSDYKKYELIKTPVQLAVESSITLILNDEISISLQVSPLQLDALSVGYLICEGLTQSLDEILGVDYKPEQGKIFIWLKSAHKPLKIQTEIRSSGCVGVQQLIDLQMHIESTLRITAETLFQAQSALLEHNELWKITGGVHISGLFTGDGGLKCYAEDVGRHNTIDKVVGEALLKGIDLKNVFLITSGRISAGTVVKCARAGIPIVVSKATPLDKGIEIAKKVNMTLIGFAREPSMNIYTVPDRIIFQNIKNFNLE